MSALIPGFAPGIVSPGAPIDWTGNYVPDSQQYYSPYVQIINGQRMQGPQVLNPNYKAPGTGTTPAALPPQALFSFDTIGQTIVRSIGHCRPALHPIWALGINESGDPAVSNTQTFAAALCAPIDPSEEGGVQSLWDGGSLIFGDGEALHPVGWSDADAALLAASLANMTYFPGDEAQLPADLIVADKGADKTNAFRGLRYIIFPNYPIGGGSGGGGGASLPKMSATFERTNDEDSDGAAVEFAAGST
ncbi:hypothetical protein J2R96_008383 [Bradyrhizobium elkanii]|nr:hypothetical protein [Bradyrhizobium elkanii]